MCFCKHAKVSYSITFDVDEQTKGPTVSQLNVIGMDGPIYNQPNCIIIEQHCYSFHLHQTFFLMCSTKYSIHIQSAVLSCVRRSDNINLRQFERSLCNAPATNIVYGLWSPPPNNRPAGQHIL